MAAAATVNPVADIPAPEDVGVDDVSSLKLQTDLQTLIVSSMAVPPTQPTTRRCMPSYPWPI